jgi:hypothetical protein
MTPVISLLHATKGRPEKAIATMRLWAERAHDPASIEYVIAHEKADTATADALDAFLPSAEMPWFEGGVVVIRGDFGGSAPAWDAAARVASGSLYIQVSDDFEPPQDWDLALLGRLPTGWEQEPLVVAVSDGLRRDRLLTMAICTVEYAGQKCEFLHAGYQSMFSDNEFTYRAYKDQDMGICRVIEARDLLFEHQHHCKTGAPEDATYAWQNRPEAYEAGRKLFNERNPHAYGKDAKLWL